MIKIKHTTTGVVLKTVDADTLRGADLRGAYLRGADLRVTDLRGADLRGANLRGAYLRDANLRGAYLRDADLRGAYLRDANLRGADLRGADLRGAYLRGADLRGADLGSVNDVAQLGFPDSWHAFCWHIQTTIIVQVGYQSFTLEQGREYSAGRENRKEVLAALDYAQRIAVIRKWS